jgi:hypothetical protein
MDIEFEWPGDADHDLLNALFSKYARMERALIERETTLFPNKAFLEQEHDQYHF